MPPPKMWSCGGDPRQALHVNQSVKEAQGPGNSQRLWAPCPTFPSQDHVNRVTKLTESVVGTGQIDVEGRFLENRRGHIVRTAHQVHETFDTLKQRGDIEFPPQQIPLFVQPQGAQSSLLRMTWHL